MQRRSKEKDPQAGWISWKKLSGVVCEMKLSARIKGKMYRSVVRPAMLNGMETVSVTERQVGKMEVAELKIVRWALGVTRKDKIRNEYVRGTEKIATLGDKLSNARLRWYGHMKRREESYVGKKMMEMTGHLCVLVPQWGGKCNTTEVDLGEM